MAYTQNPKMPNVCGVTQSLFCQELITANTTFSSNKQTAVNDCCCGVDRVSGPTTHAPGPVGNLVERVREPRNEDKCDASERGENIQGFHGGLSMVRGSNCYKFITIFISCQVKPINS